MLVESKILISFKLKKNTHIIHQNTSAASVKCERTKVKPAHLEKS